MSVGRNERVGFCARFNKKQTKPGKAVPTSSRLWKVYHKHPGVVLAASVGRTPNAGLLPSSQVEPRPHTAPGGPAPAGQRAVRAPTQPDHNPVPSPTSDQHAAERAARSHSAHKAELAYLWAAGP